MVRMIASLFDWRGSKSVSVAMIIMSLSWIVRVFMFGASYESPIRHEYVAAAMIPVLILLLIGECVPRLALRKTGALMMAVLWVVVGAPTAFLGSWHFFYFACAFCFAWLYLTMDRMAAAKDERG